MKKTLLLTKEYFPFFGGVANYCHGLFKFFKTEDYLIITDNPKVKSKNNVINLKLENKFLKPSWFFAFFKIKKIVKENKIEQIFTPNILPLGSIAYLFNKFWQIPYVISLHGLDINLALENKFKLTYKILKNSRQIIVNSQATANIVNKFPEFNNKITIIYPSLDLDFSKVEEKHLQSLKESLKIEEKTKVFLSVGRLSVRKGHAWAIEALYNLNLTDWKYLIVGNGPEKKNLEQLIAKYKLEKQIKILENIDYSDLIYYYKLAKIFLLPQRQLGNDLEGFGIVFLEAAAARLAIIAGNNGGVLEILSDQKNALLVNNIEEIEQAIKSLLSDQDLEKLIRENAYLRSRDFARASEQSNKLKLILS
ncbi:glycosyltransferase family 4 protein [Candidatus Nomurabacteria bacterium]|nr:glycosyltransferase family 4 protein [Candidatus Nomurabacteria bacterium]